MAKEPGEGKKVETVTFKYAKANDYRVIAANGVYGGPLPSGEIKADFFVEFVETPGVERFEVKDKRLGALIDRVPSKGTWIRELQIGLLLSRNTAKSIGEWLLEKVKIAEEQALKAGEKLEHGRRKE